jgi:surface protein
VQIWGGFPHFWSSANTALIAKLVSIDQWGDIAWQSFAQAFHLSSGLVIQASDTPNLSGVTTMQGMFNGATNLTGNFSGWDTSKITTMTNLFYGATNFDQDLSSWNVEKVTAANFANMFNGTQLSLYNYNAILDSRSRQNVIASVTNFNQPNIQYGGCVSNAQAGIDGHQRLTQAAADGGKVRAIVDSGVVLCSDGLSDFRPFLTTRALPSTRTLVIPTNGAGYDFEIDRGDGTIERKS